MEKITHISGFSIPLDIDNVDTDLIIPAQYLTQVTKKGYGQALFRRLRDSDANFVFNQEKFQNATILISGKNFGCGSSREHAVWALLEAGIKAIIAVSFSDIFFNNSAKNGLVLIRQPESIVRQLMAKSLPGNYHLVIDIEKQIITNADNMSHHFEMEAFRKHCFLQGLDELDYLLTYMQAIEQYDIAQREKKYATVFSALHGSE